MEYLKQFRTHISNNDLSSVVSLWEEYCLCDEIDPEETMLILSSVRETPFAPSFGVYVEQILPLWEGLTDPLAKHLLFKLVVDVQTNNSPALAEKTVLYLQSLYGNDPDFSTKLRLVGLREKEKFQGAVSNFELLVHLKKNNCVFHKGGWGVGQIIDVSFIREEISLEFEYVAGPKDLSFKNGFNTLVPLSKDHFLSRRFSDPDSLEREFKEDSVKGLKMLLKDLGPKTAAEIKDELSDIVIPEDEWAKWWQNAKSKLKKDTLVESPKAVSGLFILRRAEISHEEELQKVLDKKPGPKELIEIIYSFMKDFPGALKKIEAKSMLALQLNDLLNDPGVSRPEQLQILFILDDLSGGEKGEEIGALLHQISSFEAIINAIDILAFKKRLLINIQEYKKDWPLVFENLLLSSVASSIRDFIFSELMQKGYKAQVSSKIEEMLAHPHKSPSAFLWYFTKIMEVSSVPFADQNGKDRFLETFFVLMYLLEQKKDQKELTKKMHNLLTANRFAIVRSVFQGSPIEVVKEILLLSTKCQSLDDHDIKTLQSLAEVSHPDLATIPEEDNAIDENIIWTTEEGFLKVKEKLHHIGTVETVNNAREIETARAHGDLRENSEFKFALEKRQQLQNEIKNLSEQLNKMRIIRETDIDLSSVGIGTTVKLQNASHDETTYTLLGPWEADPDKNILSFHSKLAQELSGARVGEKRKVQNEMWTVKDIKSYLDNK